MFTHLSKSNQYHLYAINKYKIIRDDFIMDFKPLNFIEANYIKLPDLQIEEVKFIIKHLKEFPEYRDMAIAFGINIGYNLKSVRGGKNNQRVKDLLKFIMR